MGFACLFVLHSVCFVLTSDVVVCTVVFLFLVSDSYFQLVISVESSVRCCAGGKQPVVFASVFWTVVIIYAWVFVDLTTGAVHPFFGFCAECSVIKLPGT